jgi:hypothetical protein
MRVAVVKNPFLSRGWQHLTLLEFYMFGGVRGGGSHGDGKVALRLALRNAHLGVERLLLAQLEPPQRVHVALGLAHFQRLRVQVHEARRRLREGREGRLATTAPSAGRRPTIFGRSTKKLVRVQLF